MHFVGHVSYVPVFLPEQHFTRREVRRSCPSPEGGLASRIAHVLANVATANRPKGGWRSITLTLDD